MRYWKGHIYAAATGAFAVATVAFLLLAFLGGWDGTGVSLFFLALSFLALISTAICSALSFHHWIPRWERDEKRTGHVPGEAWTHDIPER